jgi:hypothetical protein
MVGPCLRSCGRVPDVSWENGLGCGRQLLFALEKLALGLWWLLWNSHRSSLYDFHSTGVLCLTSIASPEGVEPLLR